MRTAGSKRILNILVGSQGIEPILDHFLASYTKIVDMGSLNHQNWHQQICYSAVRETKSPVAVSDATEAERRRDEATYKQVDQSTPQLGIVPSEQDISVYPILSDRGFLMRLQEFHEALTKAIVNIVERWWDDTTADFPSRMPLEPRAEEILRWVAEPSKKGSMSAFADCLGNWRPDFLLTHNDLSVSSAGFQICEINSRTPYNALLHTAYKHAIMKEVIGSDSVIEPAGDFQTMIDGLFDHFDLDLPIHLVRGRDNLEREEFALFAEQKTGLRPRLVHFADLELRADDYAPDGLAVYCRVQGQQALERVHQVALALFPEEYSVLSPDMLRHLARISVNDLRTSLLVNDQRLLGIVLQELDDLVQKHGILTPDQAKAVQEGVVPTILPGSPELERIIHEGDQKKTLKSNYMFKAARESRGNGHLLGEELSIEEWEAALHGMQDPSIHADKTSYVLQPFVRQPKFDIMTDSNRAVRNSQVVGTYYTVNGRCVGLGPWRSGNGKICNVYGGGCVLVNSVTSKLA